MAMHRFRLSLIAPALAMFFGGCARGAIIDERAILGIEETGGQIRAGGRIVECVPLGNNEVQYRIMGGIDSPNEFEKSQLRIGFEHDVYFLNFGAMNFVDQEGKVIGTVVVIRRSTQSSSPH